MGGTCVLRIEDTDQSRLVPGAQEALEHSLQCVGLDFDESPDKGGPFGPYVQSQRLKLYQAYAKRLVQSGRAYRDFRPPVARNLDARSSALLRETYIPPSEEEAQERIEKGEPYVVRLKMDAGRVFTYEDVVYGRMHFRPDVMSGATDDPILVKSDGWPTYHLASVVDDTEMRISHVLRGEEWIPSMPKHLALYEALDVRPPQFVHLPLLINPDGTKLSKRTGDVRVEDYLQQGWEPETLVNLVALTGYSHQEMQGKEPDVKTMKQLIEHFDLGRISHSRATLPLDKLAFLNRKHLHAKLEHAKNNAAEKSDVLLRLRAALDKESSYSASNINDDYLLRVASLGEQRVDTLDEIPRNMIYLFQEPRWDSESCRKFRRGIPTDSFRPIVQAAAQFFAQTRNVQGEWPSWMEKQATQVAGGKAAIQKSVRIALTGERMGPPVAEIAALLGLEKSIKRCKDALAWDQTHAIGD
ncbi:glutamate--tRNA ligase [Malassezia nana]|uniref:Glutamate--tRNA ligase n=1 Tax=Malassezia nana TaxID=180528 RepID=A0AAF0EJJ6_9BASI|nr:glutamate--tRNA ligase [Malassezia nana]